MTSPQLFNVFMAGAWRAVGDFGVTLDQGARERKLPQLLYVDDAVLLAN